jgi:hypothetical protein
VLPLRILITDWNDYVDVYSAFTDSDSEAEWTHDVPRRKSCRGRHNQSSAEKRQKYGRNYSTNNWEDRAEYVRRCLEEPESSSGFESCDDSDTHETLRRKRIQRKRDKTESAILRINSLYSCDESDSEEEIRLMG